MAYLNALIAQGAQFNIPNPVDQYSKVMQLQSAQQQMQLNRQQAQQIQEDRAGFAKLRETLAGKNLTPEDYEIALTQSPDPSHQKLGIEMRFKRIRLADLDKEMSGGVKPAAEAPMAAPAEAPMAAPVAPTAPLDIKEIGDYRVDRNISPTNLAKLIKIAGQETFKIQPNEYFGNNEFGGLEIKTLPAATTSNNLAAQVAPAVVANALVAQPAAVAPVGNAMAAKQTQIAEINRKLDVLNSPRYSDLPGAKGRIDTLERQLKQLTESPFAKESMSNFTSASLAKFGQSGNPADLVPVGKEGTKSELARLMSERAALVASGAALTDARVVAYDNAITKASSPSAGQPSDVKRLIAERNAAVAANAPPDEIAALNAAIKKATTSTPPVQVSIDQKQQGAFAAGLGTGQSKRILESQTNAQAAADILATNEVGRSLLKSGAITGAGADFFVGLNKALKQGGIDFGYADATANSQAYGAAMAANVGKLIQQFGAGTAISDADREYATKAAAAEISMDEAAIRKVLDINDRAARNVIKRHNKLVKGVETNLPLEVEIPVAEPPPLPSGAALIPTGKAAATGGNVVTLPDGRTKTFPTAEAAAQFKKAAGL